MRGRLRRSVSGRRRSRGYFPRAVFFFGLGFLVLPVLAGAASFFGRFGDTCSLLPWLAVLQGLRVRARSEAPCRPAGRSARRYRSASPPCQSTEPSGPRPETAIVTARLNKRSIRVGRPVSLPASSGERTLAQRSVP